MMAPAAVTSRPQLAELLLQSEGVIDGLQVSDSAVASLGSTLHSLGLPHGSLVALHEGSPRHLVQRVLACWAADVVPLLVSRTLRGAHLGGVFDWRAGADITAPHGPPRTSLNSSVALLHGTSASTGLPKLAMRNVKGLLNEAAGYRDGLRLVPGCRLMLTSPPEHSYGCGVLLAGLFSGSSVSVAKLDLPRVMGRTLDNGGCEVFATSVPVMELLSQTAPSPRALNYLKDSVEQRVLVGASSPSEDLMRRFNRRFPHLKVIRGYGSSETGGIFLGEEGIGRPVDGVQVLSPREGETGELHVQIKGGVEGYLDDVRESMGNRGSWFMGDIVENHGAGRDFSFVARKASDMFRVNGLNLHSVVIRDVMGRVPGVMEYYCTVDTTPFSSAGDVLRIFWSGSIEASSQVKVELETSAAAPVRVSTHHVVAIPRTELGKVDRAKLLGGIAPAAQEKL